ncbi:heterokaryon incompatibility protein-domain-containing protein [Xylariaceae sp. FL0255]|nr:heterokaryon incompatibility protein-domain-containing protein [Xylariaceae sp. FL0255]
MRLLNAHTREFKEFFNADVPPYAILSHTWEAEEVSLQEFPQANAIAKAGYRKIDKFCQLITKLGFTYGWVDTCCIDKSSSAELSEAINSMFKWYEKSTICIAYLADVPGNLDITSSAGQDLAKSRWWTRGWTLQELLAPPAVSFIASNWEDVGTRDSLAELISDITGIGYNLLTTGGLEYYRQGRLERLRTTTIAEKLSWAAKRTTTRKEDTAYCLLGLCGVNMPLLYGEGSAAFLRLQEAIIRQNFDPSLLAWGIDENALESDQPQYPSRWLSISRTMLGMESPWHHREYPTSPQYHGILAESPQAFTKCGQIVNMETITEWDLTMKGLSIQLPTSFGDKKWMLLPCYLKGDPWSLLGVPISVDPFGVFHRASSLQLIDRRRSPFYRPGQTTKNCELSWRQASGVWI